MLKVLLLFVGEIVVLGCLGVPMTSPAVLPVIGLALLLAVQNFFPNVDGGLQLLVFKPFKTGDDVEAGAVQVQCRRPTGFIPSGWCSCPTDLLFPRTSSTAPARGSVRWSCE